MNAGTVHIILNPVAGQGKALLKWQQLERLLLADKIPYSLHTSSKQKGLQDLVRELAAMPADQIILIGGDGSWHEAINGWMSCPLAPQSKTALVLLPAGSGNDWARYWRIPASVKKWYAAKSNWSIREHDLGMVTYQTDDGPSERYFINVAGLAYDGWLVHKIESHIHLKGNPLVYILSILRWLLTYTPQAAAVNIEGQEIKDSYYTINAGICPYSGGGMRLVPHADPVDGLLAVTIAQKMPLARLLSNIWRFYHHSLGKVKGVTMYQTEKMDVQPLSGDPVYVEADGEFLGVAPAAFQSVPKGIRLYLPDRLTSKKRA
jgi:diacylglycerol kinase (ATP)